MQVVVGHANPDFDAYAATIAATKLFPGACGVFLGSQNANVREFHNLHEDFLDFVDLKSLDLAAIDRVIMVDTRDPGRISELGKVVTRPGVEVIVYDHHPPMEGDLTCAEDRSLLVGATTSILVHEIRDRGAAITPLEASVMLLGIHEDTGSLTFPNTTPYDAEAVTFLLEAGADMEVLNQFLVRTLSAMQRELLDKLVASLEMWDINGQDIAVGVADMETYVDSASVVTHYICEDLGYRIAIAVVRMPDRIHVVARSRVSEVDVGLVLGRLGGGGHPQAASAALRDTALEDVLARLREALLAEVPRPLSAADIGNRHVRTVDATTTMREAGEEMARWGHGGLPVVEDGRLVGIVTRKDVDKAKRHGLGHAPVTGFMARDVRVVSPSTDLADIERLLATEGIGRVPVVEDGTVVGIVTRKDLLRAEHGDEYLDRRVPQVHGEASRRFLAGVHSLLPAEMRDAITTLGRLAEERDVRAHVVGGFVRDMLLGRPNLDVDVVVEGDGLAFADAAGERMGVRVRAHKRFGTAVLLLSRDLHIDITTARTEYYTKPGALPTVERSSLRQDLLRRDFSINAMAACIDPECLGAIADPFGGLRDLERGVVRVLHNLSFVEDPTRVLRAARFEQRYGFAMDRQTEMLARQAVDMAMLDEISGARVREELLDILAEERAAACIARLAELGALHTIAPEGADEAALVPAFSDTAAAVPAIADLADERVSRPHALLVPLAASATSREAERWLRRLRFGREYVQPALVGAERADDLLAGLKRRSLPDSALYQLLHPVPLAAVPYLWSRATPSARNRIERYLTTVSRIRSAVTGTDLLAMGAEPSPEFSAILDRALADRLDGRAVGREAELDNLRRLASEAGLLSEE